MVEYNEQCKKCFHFQVCAQVMKNQLFIREKMLKEENPKCEHFVNDADVVEVRHGKWLYEPETINTMSRYRCSICFDPKWLSPDVPKAFKNCPNCGAKMDGKDGADNA